MQSIYIPGSGFVHRLHPLTKLASAVLIIVAAYLLPGDWTPLALFVATLAVAVLVGVEWAFLRAVLFALLPIVASIFLIQGVLFPPAGATPFRVGPLTLTYQGLTLGLVLSSRLLVFSLGMLLLLRTTHSADLVQALVAAGLPYSVGYIILVSLQIIPNTLARATAILETQQSRGLETQGTFRRIRALPALVGPLIIGALSDVEERAMAIESRAFLAAGPKTVLRVLNDTFGQRVFRWVVLALCLGLGVARFTVLR